jgi:8-hydroxy-5-deazaflavin:NADPH oxidoreductase
MRIAIIGSGHVGATLGQGWVKAGHEVIYASRDAGAAPPHPGAKRDTVPGAARSGEVVVLATPWPAVDEALAAAGDFAGKPLMDVTNPIGPGFALALGHTTSGAEYVASRAKNARVVKAFNTTGFENMANPRYGENRVVMPVAGDDRGALEMATRLAKDLGFDSVALPSLSRARDTEPVGMLWIKLAMQWGLGRNVAFGLSKRAAGEQSPAPKRTNQPRTITIVGSGNIGGTLARAWLRSGHTVRITARDATAPDVRELVGAGAKSVPVAGSAEGAEVVVLAIPAAAVAETASSLGKLTGKVVVDCTNAIAKGFTLQYGHTTSWSEEMAKMLPGAKVVRSFNQQGAEVLRNPLFGGRLAANFVAADDSEARALIRALSSDVGLDSVEAGPLSSARYLEPMTLLWISMSQAIGTREFGITLLRR